MSGYFDQCAAKGNKVLNELATRLGDECNIAKAARILRCTLHTFRRCLSTEESLHLISQLPLMIKAIYVDGWKVSHRERIRTWDEFLLEMLEADGATAAADFENRQTAALAVAAVLGVLLKYVSEGEMADILAQLPAQLKATLWDLIAENF